MNQPAYQSAQPDPVPAHGLHSARALAKKAAQQGSQTVHLVAPVWCFSSQARWWQQVCARINEPGITVRAVIDCASNTDRAFTCLHEGCDILITSTVCPGTLGLLRWFAVTRSTRVHVMSAPQQ